MIDHGEEKHSGTTAARLTSTLISFLLLGLLFAAAAALIYSFRVIGCSTAAISEQVDDSPRAESAALDFLTDVAAGRIEAAYLSTTARFQKQWSPSDFRQFLARHPLARDSTGRVDHFQSESGRTILQATLRQGDRDVNCTVEVIKLGELWQVDQMRFN
jgi:hypothetical protein